MALALLSRNHAACIALCWLCIPLGGVDAILNIDVCIDGQVCKCDNATVGIECHCDATTIGQLTVWPFTLHQSHQSIVLHGCTTVDLQTLSMSTYPPRNLEILSTQRLLLQHSVFHNVDGSIERLLFADTTIPTIDAYVFHQVARLKRLEFRNVTIGSIATAAFGALSDVGAILIVESRIGSIAERAFVNVTGVGNVRIANSRIDRIAADAIVLRHVADFTMLNVSVGYWGNRSLTLVNASRVTVADCKIVTMADGALTVMLAGRLAFDGNRVEQLRSGALDGLRDASTIGLVGNHIERMDADALLPLLSKDIVLNVVNNSLPCGEDFCSLVEDADLRSFESLLDGNWCVNDTRTLAEFTSMMDDEDVCRLGHSSGVGNTSLHSTHTPHSGQIAVPSSQTKTVVSTLWLSLLILLCTGTWWEVDH